MARPRAIVPVATEKNWINLLVYGEPGVGKSVLAGTSPKALILANDDNETASARVHGSNAHKWVVRDYDDLTEAYEYCRHEGHKEYDWVWLDNGTLFQEQGMDHIMADLTASRPGRQSPWIPDKPQYLLNQNRLGDLLRRFHALPMHFGLTAHVMRTEDEEGIVRLMPLFQGGRGEYSEKICGYFGLVAYMTVVRRNKEDVRKILLNKRGKFYAKDRYSSTPDGELENPTIPLLMEGIGKKLSKPAAAPVRREKVPPATRTQRSA